MHGKAHCASLWWWWFFDDASSSSTLTSWCNMWLKHTYTAYIRHIRPMISSTCHACVHVAGRAPLHKCVHAVGNKSKKSSCMFCVQSCTKSDTSCMQNIFASPIWCKNTISFGLIRELHAPCRCFNTHECTLNSDSVGYMTTVYNFTHLPFILCLLKP